MGMTDPIADMLARIRNAIMRRYKTVEFPASRIKEQILGIMKKQGFIHDFTRIQGLTWDMLQVELKYLADRDNIIQVMKRESKPGRRVYVNLSCMPRIKNGLGIAIISTSKGIMTDKEARELRVGGEWLCSIW